MRWDHSDLKLYYSCTNELFTPLWHNMKLITASHSNYNREAGGKVIEQYYDAIIQYLNRAGTQNILHKNVNFYKFWWDAEGDTLKENSIQTHKLWKELGRPRAGDIYLNKTKAKMAYKSYIANKAKMEKNEISNSLHDAY